MENWDQSVKNQLEKQTPFDNSNPQPSAAAAASVGNDGTVTPNVAPDVSVNLNPNLDAAELSAVTAAIRVLQDAVKVLGVPEVTAAEKSHLLRLGKRAGFTKDALNEARQTPGLVPPDFDLTEVELQQGRVDELHAQIAALEHILDRLKDAAVVEGNLALGTSLALYKVIKTLGKSSGTRAAAQRLKSRFRKAPAAKAPAAPTPPPTTATVAPSAAPPPAK